MAPLFIEEISMTILLVKSILSIVIPFFTFIVIFNPSELFEKQIAAEETRGSKITVGIDEKSILAGKALFDEKCYFCHDAHSNNTIVGPGLKSVIKNPELPISKKPAIPENIANQLRNPYRDMPSFSYLPEEDVLNLIAFLKTL